jgi:ABC-type multidrug transport system ATPase subunit
MDLVLNNIGKRYRFDWIFRHINYHFKEGRKYAILGPNGSGKSTLMKVLSGHLTPSKGKIEFQKKGSKILVDRIYRSVSYAAPYIDVIEEMTLEEAINFHKQFKPMLDNLNTANIIELLNFSGSKNKEIRFFSSGMKQRLKLALSICSDTPLLLLDEPTTNLDQQGFDWYQDLIQKYNRKRTVIVASNVESDYHFCDEQLNILDFKKKVKV